MSTARRELCRHCNQRIGMLPSGRLAYHHYVAPGIGVPCPGVPANGTRSQCAVCDIDIDTDEDGRARHHYVIGKQRVFCSGSGKWPAVAA